MGASRSGMHMQLADTGAFACLCTRRMLLLHSAPMLVLALCKYMNSHCCNSVYSNTMCSTTGTCNDKHAND